MNKTRIQFMEILNKIRICSMEILNKTSKSLRTISISSCQELICLIRVSSTWHISCRQTFHYKNLAYGNVRSNQIPILWGGQYCTFPFLKIWQKKVQIYNFINEGTTQCPQFLRFHVICFNSLLQEVLVDSNRNTK